VAAGNWKWKGNSTIIELPAIVVAVVAVEKSFHVHNYTTQTELTAQKQFPINYTTNWNKLDRILLLAMVTDDEINYDVVKLNSWRLLELVCVYEVH